MYERKAAIKTCKKKDMGDCSFCDWPMILGEKYMDLQIGDNKYLICSRCMPLIKRTSQRWDNISINYEDEKGTWVIIELDKKLWLSDKKGNTTKALRKALKFNLAKDAEKASKRLKISEKYPKWVLDYIIKT